MSDFVWLSMAMNDPRRLRPLTSEISAQDIHKAVDFGHRNDAGEPMTSDCFPKIIFPNEYANRPFKSLPDLFFAGSYWAVSERCAHVLQQYNLGCGALYPVKVLQKDRITPIGDHGWYCINFGNVKQAVNIEQSQHLKQQSWGPWADWAGFGDDSVAVASLALSGPDIWIDPIFDGGLFISFALGNALKKAKCASGWGLTRCRVVEG